MSTHTVMTMAIMPIRIRNWLSQSATRTGMSMNRSNMRIRIGLICIIGTGMRKIHRATMRRCDLSSCG
jgi:hypothetical protein